MGQKEPVKTWIFVPGLNCTAEIWEGASRLLGVKAVCLEWPESGIGSMDEAALWLGEHVDEHEAAGVVGHSLGGTTALHLYGHLGRRPTIPLAIVDSFMAPPHPMFRNHVWEPPEGLRERIAAMLAEQRPRFAQLRDVALAFEEDPAWIEAAVETGAHFFYGGRGGDVPNAEVARRAGVPEAAFRQVQVVPKTSHFLMLEQPKAFYGLLSGFIR